MIRKILALVALCILSSTALATTIPGESPYCVAHCINGICQPVIAALGEKNFSIGLPLGVIFGTVTGGSEIKPATQYSWGWLSGSHGTPTNLTGISTATGNSYTISKITMSDSGLYVEIGSAAPGPLDISGGSTTLDWCITVNPVAILNNNLLIR